MRSGEIAGVILIVIALATGAFLFNASRSKDVVLFYHGAAAEVPQGRVVVVFNPFRNRDSENTAELLIHDLETGDCQRVVQALSSGTDYDPRVCLVMGSSGKHSLVWHEDGEQSRVIVYDIPEKQARLWITFRRHESGFEVSSVSVAR
jgi:hypothetical protein